MPQAAAMAENYDPRAAPSRKYFSDFFSKHPKQKIVVGHPQNMASTPDFAAPEEGYLHDIASERSEEATRSCSGHYFVIMFNFMRIGQEMSCQHGCDRRAPRWARNALLPQQGACEKDVGIVLILLHETVRTAMAASTVPPRTRTKVGRG